MKNNIDDILKDLYALDPTLSERDLDVRAFISAFAEEKPTVTIDETFVRNLRDTLVQPRIVSPYHTSHEWNWWMFRLLPVGATLLLILMLVPDLQHTQTLTPTTAPTMETSLFVEEGAPTTRMAPSAKQASVQDEDISLMMDSRMVSPGDSFTLGEQNPGDVVLVLNVSLLQEGFIAIHTDVAGEPGTLLGVSSLLAVGQTERVLVSLSKNLVEGTVYQATLYADDGDGVFIEQQDTPVVDPISGTVLRAPFSVFGVTPVGE